MWLFTKYGFYSVVEYQGHDVDPKNPVMIVRARRIEHIANLQVDFSEIAGETIHTSIGTDYKYRIFVNKEVWKRVMVELVENIDYGNFKDAAYEKGFTDGYEEALVQTWWIMKRVQDKEGDDQSDLFEEG